jgi:hypothetical protein
MGVFKRDRGLDNRSLPAYTGDSTKSPTRRSTMKCKVCGKEVVAPKPIRADGQVVCCCDDIGCQEDFDDWLDNAVIKVEKVRDYP